MTKMTYAYITSSATDTNIGHQATAHSLPCFPTMGFNEAPHQIQQTSLTSDNCVNDPSKNDTSYLYISEEQ